MYQTKKEEEMEKECRNLMAHFRADDDYWEDYENYKRCLNALNSFEKDRALMILKYLIGQYKLQIDEWAYLYGGRYLQGEESYDTADIEEIMADLHYIEEHIPAYIMMREGKTEEASYLMEWFER